MPTYRAFEDWDSEQLSKSWAAEVLISLNSLIWMELELSLFFDIDMFSLLPLDCASFGASGATSIRIARDTRSSWLCRLRQGGVVMTNVIDIPYNIIYIWYIMIYLVHSIWGSQRLMHFPFCTFWSHRGEVFDRLANLQKLTLGCSMIYDAITVPISRFRKSLKYSQNCIFLVLVWPINIMHVCICVSMTGDGRV